MQPAKLPDVWTHDKFSGAVGAAVKGKSKGDLRSVLKQARESGDVFQRINTASKATVPAGQIVITNLAPSVSAKDMTVGLHTPLFMRICVVCIYRSFSGLREH